MKQRYGPGLRSKTQASLKPEILHALDSLMDKCRTKIDTKVFRTTLSPTLQHSKSTIQKSRQTPTNHFLSMYEFLRIEYNQFMSHARQSFAVWTSYQKAKNRELYSLITSTRAKHTSNRHTGIDTDLNT